jgi:hypothetical protein
MMQENTHDTQAQMAGIILRLCEISSSHGGKYEAQNLLGCTAAFLKRMSTDVSEVCAASIIRAMSRHSLKNTAVHPRRF